MQKLRIVVGGFIGLYPTGGVTWDYLQYVLGFAEMGHDVYYIEDTCQYPRYQKEGRAWDDATDSIHYLKEVMKAFGLEQRWAYRDVASGKCFGLSIEKVNDICRTADVFINVSASTFLREEYLSIPRRVLIDSDPMFTQIEYHTQKEQNKEHSPYKMDFVVENHNYLFTFGENVGNGNCEVPTFGFKWHPTRQPISLKFWLNNDYNYRKQLSTIMNWSVSQSLDYNNKKWGQKNAEFEKLLVIPSHFRDFAFDIIISNLPEAKKTNLEDNGWNVIDPLTTIISPQAYHEFIATSGAELSVAKQTYVHANSGWFSCRSACYLASGRPVITQDTGWSGYIPSGLGLFSFTDFETAAEAIKVMSNNPAKHSNAAREIAIAYFDSVKVLNQLLETIYSSPNENNDGND